jgi:hypothetical protein
MAAITLQRSVKCHFACSQQSHLQRCIWAFLRIMDMGNVQTIHRCSGIGTNDLQAQGLAVPQFDCHCADIENVMKGDNGDEVAQDLKRERVGFMDLTREENILPRESINNAPPNPTSTRSVAAAIAPSPLHFPSRGTRLRSVLPSRAPGRSCRPAITFEQSQNPGISSRMERHLDEICRGSPEILCSIRRHSRRYPTYPLHLWKYVAIKRITKLDSHESPASVDRSNERTES